MDNNISERLLKIETNQNSIKILKSLDFAKLYNGRDTKLWLSNNCKNFEHIDRFFRYANIDLESNKPLNPDVIYKTAFENIDRVDTEEFNITFDLGISFQDLFIIVEILTSFGLEKIFYSNRKGNNLIVGSESELSTFNFSDEIQINEILNLPFFSSTIEALAHIFKVDEPYILKWVDKDIEKDEYLFYNEKQGYDDYDRDNFNALTDGQYGDYDDWKSNGGDYDDLRDGIF